MNIILEGARGLGKSTITRRLRSNKMHRILTNHTGMNGDSPTVKQAMDTYYNEYLNYLSTVKDLDFTMIHDRFFISEMVMSKLYKTTYDFDEEGLNLARRMSNELEDTKIIFIVNYNEEELYQNLNANDRIGKANLFEDDKIKDDVSNTLKQQEMYDSVIRKIESEELKNITVYRVNAEGKSIDILVDEIEQILV